MLKIGIIGAGFMGRMHSNCYAAMPDTCKITAVADCVPDSANAIADKSGAQTYGSGMELIKNADVDIVDICLPTYLHASHAIASMEAGIATFIEKPVCRFESEGIELLAVQKRTGVPVMVGQCIRLWDEYAWVKDAYASGRLGALRSGYMKRISPTPTWSWDNWLLDDKRSGSVALDMHIHDTDFVRSLMGEPDNISAAKSYGKNGEIIHIFTSFNYKNAVIMAEGCWDYPASFPFSMGFRFCFENATAIFDSGNQPLTVYWQDGEAETPSFGSTVASESAASKAAGGNISSLGAYYNELKYFTERVAAKAPIKMATLEDSVRSVELVLREINL